MTNKSFEYDIEGLERDLALKIAHWMSSTTTIIIIYDEICK